MNTQFRSWARPAVLLALLAPVSLLAQDLPQPSTSSPDSQVEATAPPPPPAPAPITPPDPAKPEVNAQDKELRDEVPKRIFWIIPNFMTANDVEENRGPLTSREKWSIAWHQFVDPSAHYGNLLQASISQAANGLPHYGQGWGAFGQRFAAQEGDQLSGSMLIYGALPTLLHHDPRYFRKGRGSSWSRVLYAASRVIISRTDAGKPTFNASSVFGQLGQASISMLYYPQQDRRLGGVLSGWAINQGYNIGWNQLKEFTPDLNALIRRHSRKYRDEQLKGRPSPAPASMSTATNQSNP